MQIGIDASRLMSEHSTGVEHYSWQIIKGILEEAAVMDSEKRPKLLLYSRDKVPQEVMDTNHEAENKVIRKKRLWTILGLSKEMRSNTNQTLFVPSHTLPPRLPMHCVITIHDVAFKYLRSSYSLMQYHYLNLSAKFAVKHASKIIVPSEATKKDLIQFYNCDSDKLEVIEHGFSEPKVPRYEEKLMEQSPIFAHFGIDKDTKYILFVGRLESKKNLVRLVEAFKKFSQEHSDYLLILAGKRGVGFEKILKKVKQLGMEDRVIMPGYVTEEEKFLLYKYCRFFAFPSLYEGFGFPVLESFYHRKPVLCASMGSLPEVGMEAVEYCDPYSVDSIGEGLRVLAKDDAHCKDLVERGVKQLEKFQWKRAAKRTLEVLMNC